MKDLSQALQKTMTLPCRLLLFCANGQTLFFIPPAPFYRRLYLLYWKRANEGILITNSELRAWTRWLRGFGCCNFVKLINGNICFLSAWSRKYFLSFFSYQNYLTEEGWGGELIPWCHSYSITGTSIISSEDCSWLYAGYQWRPGHCGYICRETVIVPPTLSICWIFIQHGSGLSLILKNWKSLL